MANPFDLAEAELTARAPFGAKQEPIFGAIAARRKAEAEANPWDTAEAKLSAQPPPPEASTGKLGGAYYALKRGVMTAVALPDVISATGTAGLGKPTMGQERRAFEASMTDPRYQAEAMSAKTPERAARVENTLGQKAKLGQIMAPGLTLQSADSDAVTQARQEIAAVPKSPAQIRIAQARTSAEKWNVWLQDPVELTASIAFESLPPSIAGSTIGSVFGPAGMVAGVGAASALTTFGSEFLNNASEMGVDITDPISFQKFLNDEPSFRAAFEPAMVKSGIVGGVDALTAGQAGRWIEPALKQGFRQKLLASAQELGLQMGGGAGGEFAGQVATGQQLDPFDIAMEAMAEVATAPGEIIGNLRNKAHADQKQASSRIPPSDSSAGFNPSGEAGATPAPPDNQSGKPGLVTGALESARQASTPDNTPATKADLKALADFIQNGGNNPFAPKSASAPADVTEKPTQTITGSNVQPGTEMPVQPQAGAATLKPEGTVIKARDGSNARYIKRNGQWYRRPNAGSSEVLVEDGDVISILEQDTTTLPHADAGQTARAPGSRPLATATQPFAAKPHRYFIRMAGSQKAFEVQSLTDARAKLQAMKDSGVNLNGDILDETGKLIGEITNGRQRIFPDESQSQAGAATTLPPAAAGQTATATPVTQTALPAGGTLPAQPPAQGGENTNGQKEKGRGQTLLKQPENKIVAPAAVLTTPPATPAKPARGRKGFRIQPRSDGIVDVLDAIQEEGGLRSPTAADVADGDYDGFKEAMIGPAALLRRRTEGYHPTEIIKFIQAEFPRIKTSGDLYQAIRDAVAQRDNLRRNGGGAEAQQQRFWDAATGPKSTSGLVKINTNQLAVGHVFRLRAPGVSHEELTVTHVDADTGEVQVKDGTSFGVQDLPDGAEIWVQKKGLAPELQAAQVKPTDAPPVANATPGNQPAAQPGGKPKAGGAVPASASDPGAVRAGERLERAIRGVAGNENVTIKLSGPPTGNGLGNGAGRSLASGLQSIADVFGKRIVWFTASDLESGRNLRGYADPGGKYILVNSDYPLTALGTAIHELLHQFQNSNPVLYADFKRDMLAMAKLTGSTYQDVKWSANAYGHDLSDELMCDFAAHAFNDPKFVRDFAARDPGLFRRVVNRLVKLLDRILFQLTRTQKTASEVFPDLQAARDRLAKALVEWADYEQNVKKVRAEIDKANGENKPAKLKTALKASNATLTKPGLVNINPPEPPPQFSITAHHGTPHKVDKFTTEKIGTGEGQQVYGWGLYFAENEKVAADYANRLGGQPKPQRLLLDGQEYGQLSGSLNSDEESAFYELDQRQHWWNPDKVDPLAKVEQELTKTVENYQRVRAAIKSGRGIAEQGYTERDMQAFLQAEHTLNWLNKNRDRMQVARQTKGGGNQYTIELNADPEEFLDWDKPFNEQSEFVQSALVRTGLAPELAKFNSGQAIYAQIPRGTSGHPKVASGKLEEVGIRGIRYLDQGSRNPPGRPPAPSDYDIQRAKDEIASWKVAKTGFRSEADRQQTIASWTAKLAMLEDRKQRSESWKPPVGTYNYVVFNEGDIQITHENGQPVTTAQAFSTDFDNDLFSAPESVADQKARLDREKRATDERKAKEAMQARAAARLTGKDIDTTLDAFANDATTRLDKSGQGSFFDRKAEYRVDNPALRAVASAYDVAPETATQILNDHKPYQQDFGLDDPLFAPPKGKATNPAGTDGGKPAQGISAGTDGGLEPQAGSLATHKAADFQRDFARNPLISSIKPGKTAAHAVPVYNVNGQVINSPADFARTMLSIRSPYNESLKIAILDANNVVQHSETLYAGALDGLYADARDFLRLFEKHAGAGRRMYFAHNHPSGVVTPSAADVSVTAKVRRAATAAGFEIVDHVITNGHAYYSFNSQSVETLNNPNLADWEVISRADLQHRTVSDDSDLKRLVEALRQGNQDFIHVIYLNTRNHVTAIERMSPRSPDFARRVIRGIAREGAMNVLIDFGPKISPTSAADATRTINADSGSASRVIDFSAQSVMSGRVAGYISDAPMGAFETDMDPPDIVTLDKLKSDITAAEQALKTAVRAAVDPNRAIPRADADQAAALATANLRALQDEYDKHPDRLRAMPLSELEAHAQATAARLAEIAETPVATGNQLPDDLRGERWRLMREAKRIAAERWNRPEIVADALRKAEKLTDALRAASKAQDATAMRHAIEELQALQDAEFTQIKPDLLAAVRADLEAKGEIKPLAADKRGRTLADLTDWMKARKLDSPKLTLKERVNLAKRLADEFNAGKDKLTHALVRSRAMWQAFKAQWKAPIKDDSVRSIFKEWHYEKQFSGIETHQFASKLRADIPKKVRRMAISVWLDANGDRGLLTAQKMDVPARFLPVWTAALNLTADEKALAMRLKQDFAQKLADGQLLGLIEKGRDSYGVPQIWEVFPQHGEDYAGGDGKSKRPRNPGAKLDPRDPFFALKRTHDTYFDGIMAGGIPRSLDIADLVGVYNVEFHGALADRSVIKALKDAKMPDNTAAVKVSGGAKIEVLPTGARVQFVDSNWKPADAVAADGRPYRAVDHWALRGWKFAATDAAGNPIMVQGDFLVHPDLYANIKTQLEGKSALRDPEGPLGAIAHVTGALLNTGAFLKASKFASATFHGATLAEHMMTHAFSGKPSRERLGLLNPYVGGVEINPSRDREVANLIRHGMDMGFGGYRAMFEEGLTSHGGIWAHVPGLGDGMAWLSDGMFKEYLPRLKVKLGKAVLHANRARYSSKLTEQQIYELTASQVNAAFGGQNWALLGRSKTFLDVNRLFLTAPDFLLSRAKVVGQAFKPYNREQSLFILAQAALVYALARILNLLLDDDPHWEPENALQVIHNGKAWSARFIVNDMLHAATDPAGFASGRLGPWPRTGFEMITGRDMRTGARKDVPIDTENPAFRAAQIAAVDLAQWLIPVGADGLLPGATGREQTGPGQFALGLVGVGSRRYTAETEMFQLAAKFNRGSEDPRANRQQKMRDDAPKQQSAYRKLDVLLEVDDLPAARKEYLALQKDGHTKDAIAARMKAITDGHLAHPFTGSQEREKQFKTSLTPEQKMEYERAVALRKERAQKFSRMLNQQN